MTLRVGDKVRVERERGRSGTWGRYDGRHGWVAVVDTQTFQNGTTYTEIGVRFSQAADLERSSAEAWFRTDEVVAL